MASTRLEIDPGRCFVNRPCCRCCQIHPESPKTCWTTFFDFLSGFKDNKKEPRGSWSLLVSGRSSWIATVEGRLPAPVKLVRFIPFFTYRRFWKHFHASEVARFLKPSTVISGGFLRGKSYQPNGQAAPWTIP